MDRTKLKLKNNIANPSGSIVGIIADTRPWTLTTMNNKRNRIVQVSIAARQVPYGEPLSGSFPPSSSSLLSLLAALDASGLLSSLVTAFSAAFASA